MATTIENFVLSVKTVGAETIGRLQNSMKGLSDQTTKTQSSLDGINKKLDEFAGNLGDVPAPINNIAQAMSRLGAIGTTIGTLAVIFTGLGLQAVAAADQLDDLANATGMTASQLNSLKFGIVDAGGKMDSFEKIAGRLSQSIGEAADGNENLQKAFQKLGVFVTDANGQIRPTGDILNDISAALSKIPDAATRAALATALLGKEAARLDLTRLKIEADPELDRRIQALADLNSQLDKFKQEKANALITFFGDYAIAVKAAGAGGFTGKLIEDIGRLTGYILNIPTNAIAASWNVLVPEWLRIGNPAGLGDPFINLANKAEQARSAIKSTQDTLSRLGVQPNEAAGAGRGTQGAQGGFGSTPEATLKAVADNEKRILQSRIETNRLAQLQISSDAANQALLSANSRQAIDIRADEAIRNARINLASDLAKERENIFAQERLTDAQKEAAYQAKRIELETKASGDIAKIRAQAAQQAQQARMAADARLYGAYETEREQIAREQAAEADRIQNIIRSANQLVNTYKLGNTELQARLNLDTAVIGLTDLERKYAMESFNIERERLRLLQEIANIKDLPYEERIRREKEINDLAKQRQDILTNGAALEDQQRQNFTVGWIRAYRQFLEDTNNTAKYANDIFTTFTRGFEDAMVRFVQTGKLSFKDLANSIIADLVRIQTRRLLVSLMGGSSGLGANPIGTFFSSLFGGAKAMGGPVNANTPYIVGEKGPELFMPRSPGNIIPNHRLDSSSTAMAPQVTQVTYQIQAVDASSFRSLVARDPEFIFNVTEKGRRSLPLRSRR